MQAKLRLGTLKLYFLSLLSVVNVEMLPKVVIQFLPAAQ